MANPLALPTKPDAARVFFGFRAAHLKEGPDDSEGTKATKRAEFLRELGETFMPGTPLMQAPLGLAAYLPVVIDPPAGSGLPDEVAIIVYASREIYESTRETSLSRRMYTRSHAAVFDMGAAMAAFPTGIDQPTRIDTSVGEVTIWHLFESPDDWQDAEAGFLLIHSDEAGADLVKTVTDRVRNIADDLRAGGCLQVIAGCARTFAALWLHAERDAGQLDRSLLVPDGAEILRDLTFTPVWVRGDHEPGVSISEASAYNWRFARDLRYFV